MNNLALSISCSSVSSDWVWFYCAVHKSPANMTAVPCNRSWIYILPIPDSNLFRSQRHQKAQLFCIRQCSDILTHVHCRNLFGPRLWMHHFPSIFTLYRENPVVFSSSAICHLDTFRTNYTAKQCSLVVCTLKWILWHWLTDCGCRRKSWSTLWIAREQVESNGQLLHTVNSDTSHILSRIGTELWGYNERFLNVHETNYCTKKMIGMLARCFRMVIIMPWISGWDRCMHRRGK